MLRVFSCTVPENCFLECTYMDIYAILGISYEVHKKYIKRMMAIIFSHLFAAMIFLSFDAVLHEMIT